MNKKLKNWSLGGGIVTTIVAILFLCFFLPGAGSADHLIVKPNIVKCEMVEGLSTPLTGTTNAAGEVIFTFTNDFTVMPNVQVNPIAGTDKWNAVTTTPNKNSIKVKITTRNTTTITILGATLEILLSSVTPVNGARVDILVTANNN